MAFLEISDESSDISAKLFFRMSIDLLLLYLKGKTVMLTGRLEFRNGKTIRRSEGGRHICFNGTGRTTAPIY